MKNSIVKIESITNDSFGTGFVIDRDTDGVYILTCQHIIAEVERPIIDQVLAKVIVEDSFIDMAVLYVSKLSQEPLILHYAFCDKLRVEIIGFSHFNQQKTQKQHISATLFRETVELHSKVDNRHCTVHKIKVNDGFDFNHGNSGSPVICKKSKNIIAMISYKKGSDIGYAIDIKYLKTIWRDMPKGLLSGEKKKIKEPSKVSLSPKKPKLKVVLYLFLLLFGVYSLSYMSYFNPFSSSQAFVEKYQNIEIILKEIRKEKNQITAVIVFQNNGDKNIDIQYNYSHIKMTDENGKIWKIITINSMNSIYSKPTVILNDGRRIISEHIFKATDSVDGKDFYMSLEYIINGEKVLFGFDHIRL